VCFSCTIVEECDDGNMDWNDGCSDLCIVEPMGDCAPIN